MPKITEAEKMAILAVKNQFGELLATHVGLLEAALGVTVENIRITRNETEGIVVEGSLGFNHEDIKELAANMTEFRKSAN